MLITVIIVLAALAIVAAMLFSKLETIERKLIMTQQELSVALDGLTTKVGKVAKEQSDRFDNLSAEIKRLTDVIEAGEVKPEVATALANTQAALENLDAAIPDAPEPPPVP